MSSVRTRLPRDCVAAALLCALLATHGGADAAGAAPAVAAKSPPRIGLALSGGGARGLAHVGVLKALEEMRIPIHCVTGTSMGAIVGATFASGTSPAKIEEFVLAADWAEIFRDNPPRSEISMRRKADDFKTLMAPEFGVQDGGLALPKGLIAGISIEAFFRVLAAPAVDISDFRKLPIPFEAMATDIEDGAAVVLSRGSVAQAMRASMAVPGAIAPVEIDGKLLVDGGIANNLPIDQARKLCADVVIAVNISTPPLPRKEITSALSVTAQLINFLGRQTVEQQLKSMGAGDVLIEPALGDISSTRFDRSADAIRIGAEATRALRASLARYSLPPEQYAALRAKQVAERGSLGTVDEIRFSGLERTNPEVLRGLMDSRPGEPLAEETIGADLRRIFGRGDFESVDYHIESEGGPRAMVVTPREKRWGPDYLRFGLGLASDFQGDNAFSLLVQYRRTWLNRLGGEWLTEVQVGQDSHVSSEFFQPLDETGIWFTSLYGRVGRTTRNVFDGDDNIADYLVGTARAGIDAGAILGTKGMLRIGGVWTDVNARIDTGDPVLPSVREVTAGPRLRFTLDQFDNAWFPRDGYGVDVSYYAAKQSFGSALDYQRLEGRASHVQSSGPHTINLFAAGGTDLGTDMPAYETFSLGGPLRLSGFRLDQFSGRKYAFGRAVYYNQFFRLPDLLGSGTYVGASAEVGRITDRADGLSVPGTLYSASVFVGASTFLGPAYLGAGIGNNGAASLYLLLGAP
jgi:NTE family protein